MRRGLLQTVACTSLLAGCATFNSIWRLEAPGVWRVVFDKGSEVCKP